MNIKIVAFEKKITKGKRSVFLRVTEKKNKTTNKLNGFLVRERTTPTERPPFVGEVSVNCYG
jgi:hypothetical protein